MAKYKAFKKADVFNVIAESNNKAEMIKVAKKIGLSCNGNKYKHL